MRLLGIDFGAARTGLALSDPLAITCSPLEVVHERDEDRLAQRIHQVVAENDVQEVVVGLPRPLGGGSNAQQQAAEAFAQRLSSDLGLPIRLWDERFTTKLAESGRGRGGSRGARKGKAGITTPRDAVAACHLLQSYLDSQKSEDARDEVR